MDTTSQEWGGADDRARARQGMEATQAVGADPGPRLRAADTLIGHGVHNREGEDLGTIKAIMLDLQAGRIAYAVLSSGGFLGMGEKLFAVSWDALARDAAHQRFILDVARDRLADATGFDPDRWPDRADETLVRRAHADHDASDTIGAPAAVEGRDPARANDRGATNHTGLTPDSIAID